MSYQRLTFRFNNAVGSEDCETQCAVMHCLAEYEDSGLSPAEVAKIVKCADCRFASHDTNHPKLWLCSNSNYYKEDNDFCSKGMAKDTKEFEK